MLANATLKARTVAARSISGALVIACDTDVALDGRVLGKPTGEREARATLELLSGRTHEVLSGVAIAVGGDEPRTAIEVSRVRFRDLDPDLIELYLRSGEWRGKAGGYAIQGLGSILVAGVEGDFSNIVGLPIGALRAMIPELFAAATDNPPEPYS